MHTYIYRYIHTYMYRERERERDINFPPPEGLVAIARLRRVRRDDGERLHPVGEVRGRDLELLVS